MARTIARLQVAALEDPDFQALTTTAQWTYWIILQQRRLSLAGTIDSQPRRWATVATDATVEDVEAGITELVEHRYLIADDATGELLVRTFVRHDLDTSRLSRNIIKGFWSAWKAVYSPQLQAAIIAELDDELWQKMAPLAPSESERHRTDTPTRMGTAIPIQMGEGQKVEKPRSAPSESKPPSPIESPLTTHHSPLNNPSDLQVLNTTTGVPDVPEPPGGGGNPKSTPETRASLAVAAAADQLTNAAAATNPDAYRASIIRRMTTDGTLQRITELATHRPDYETPDLVEAITNPSGNTTSAVENPQQKSHPAIHAAAHPQACPDCSGGWTIDDTGSATACPTCQTAPTP